LGVQQGRAIPHFSPIASRLEGQSKTYGVPIIVGEETVNSTPDFAWFELDLIRVIGKNDPVRIFALLGDNTVKTEKWFTDASECQKVFLESYRNQLWDDAITGLKKLKDLPEVHLSTLAEVYRERIVDYREHDLGADWDGVYSATSK
jgi:adenylate cyclase